MTTSTLSELCHSHLQEMHAREVRGALGRHYIDKRGQVHLRPLRIMARLVRIQQEFNNRTK